MTTRHFIPFLCLLMCFSACKKTATNQSSSAIKVPTVNEQILHHWDNFDFSNKDYLKVLEANPNLFNSYAAMLQGADSATLTQSVNQVLSRAEVEPTGTMYKRLLDIFDQVFHDPNSPLRNEEVYIRAMQYVVQDTATAAVDKIRPKYLLNLMMKNRVGDVATDFVYTLQNGKQGRMKDVLSPYTLLFFYNPGCPACAETIRGLKESPVINALLENGALKILAFYPDRDRTEWKKHFADIPETWINGYDRTVVVKDQEWYDLKAIPTLYLLDETKRVLLKDTTLPQIEQWFQR